VRGKAGARGIRFALDHFKKTQKQFYTRGHLSACSLQKINKATWVKSSVINSLYKTRTISIPLSTFRIKNQQHKIILSNQ
jgi:hypothetical protein